ncbi:MAG: histidine phosphatase family protein [Kofleriaceae bacterium]|nr:histidine phosphatase family protein [Kofleriaceae bacterium]
MGTLYLIRHGQASYGEADYDRLSARGCEQARAVGTWLAKAKIDALHSGPLKRQVQTAEYATGAATALGVTLPVRAELEELAEYPAFEMLRHMLPRLAAEDPRFAVLETSPTPQLLDKAFHTILHKWASDEWVTDEVERVSAFVARVRNGIVRVLAAAPAGARIACVTSAGPIAVAVGLTFGIPEARMVRQSIVIRNASITELRFRSQGFSLEETSLVTFNNTGHLPDHLHSER